MSKTTLVLGASENPERYSNKAVKSLTAKGFPVIAVGRKIGAIEEIPIRIGQPILNEIDSVTIYLSPKNQIEYYNYILNLHPRRIIFNPGAENQELVHLAEKLGIICESACTLVLLSTNQY